MYLEKINSPADLKGLNPEQLCCLAQEIRARIIEVVSKNGGHLASSLGTVELILALHYCLNTPRDKIIFDVGHQAYAHKILTGRNSKFSTLRQYQGISGFPAKDESVYDTFTCGHSSNAVSLSLGLACARDALSKEEQFKVACVIGDGSLSGGLCFEGLNNTGHLKKDILVILNTNELSIAPNVGAISNYLNKIISLPVYNRFHSSVEHFLTTRVPRGSRLLKLMMKFEEGIKGLFVPGMLFEELGFRYFGPIDGHDLNILTSTLKNILEIKGPRLLHIVTKKGKGCSFAEKDPVKFHGIGKFDAATGEVAPKAPGIKSYTDIFSDKLMRLAGENKHIVAITAAMAEGTGLDKFRGTFGDRFFDCGIAEAHAVSFAAGLARLGQKPVVAIYSTFLQRAYDQILQDVSLQELPVVLAVDRAGIVGADGVTHQGIFDLAYLKSIPHLVIMAPAGAQEMEQMLEFALNLNKPVAIRYPRARAFQEEGQVPPVELGKGCLVKEGKDFAVVALGSMVEPAKEALEQLEKQGLSGTLINARFAAPLDEKLIREACKNQEFIFTLEEGIKDGGFGGLVAEKLNRPVQRLGLPLEFIPHGERQLLLKKYKLDCAGIAESIFAAVKKECLKS